MSLKHSLPSFLSFEDAVPYVRLWENTRETKEERTWPEGDFTLAGRWLTVAEGSSMDKQLKPEYKERKELQSVEEWGG